MENIRVAGVTFTNSNGESRQTILQKLGVGYHYAILNQTTFDGERAVEVWVDSKMIGYVPKINLDDPISYESILVAQIGYYEDPYTYSENYWASLSPIQTPTEEEYQAMIKFCDSKHIPLPVVCDKRAYDVVRYETK